MDVLARSLTVSELDPQDKLFAAISILQAHILAEESGFAPEKLFGVNHLKEARLEMVERLLQDLVPCLDQHTVNGE